MNPLFSLILLVLLMQCGHENSYKPKAASLETKDISSSFDLYTKQPTVDQLSIYIGKTYPERNDPQLSNWFLAHKIINVARCFKIDSTIFAALIQQESEFNRTAQSPTGAIGLSQFQDPGIEEVHDHFGVRGSDYFNPKFRDFFNYAIQKCYWPEAKKSPQSANKPDFIPLFKRSAWGNSEVSSITASRRSYYRKQMQADPDLALVYAAVYLKGYLASYNLTTTKTMKQRYEYALGKYNNDLSAYAPGITQKDHYISMITKKIAPVIQKQI